MKHQFCVEPAGSKDGDCYRACLASILNLPVRQVPNFAAAGDWDSMFKSARAWLQERGLGIFRTYCSASWQIDTLLKCFSADNPEVPIIVMGHSGKPGSVDNHAVVALSGKVIHDPGRCGLNGPVINGDGELGWWWLDIIAFADFSNLTNLQPEPPRP